MARTHRTIQNGLNDWDNHDSVVIHLEPDILECEGKWALGSITANKASRGDEIPAEPLKILKDDAVKVLHSICQKIWKTQQWPQDWKRSVFIPIPKKGNVKECSNYHTTALISHDNNIIFKIFQVGFSNIWTENIQMYKLGLEDAEEPEIKLPTFVGSWRKQRNSRKISTSASWTMLKPVTLWITMNCGKFFNRWEYQTTLPVSWEGCIWVKKQQLEPDMEQWTGSKLGKEYIKVLYSHPIYLTYMQGTSGEMLGWMKLKLESRLPGEISTTSDMQMIPLYWQKVKRNWKAS